MLICAWQEFKQPWTELERAREEEIAYVFCNIEEICRVHEREASEARAQRGDGHVNEQRRARRDFLQQIDVANNLVGFGGDGDA